MISEKLKFLRKKKNYQQKDLAKELGFPQSKISKLENIKNLEDSQKIAVQDLIPICKHFGVWLDDFVNMDLNEFFEKYNKKIEHKNGA